MQKVIDMLIEYCQTKEQKSELISPTQLKEMLLNFNNKVEVQDVEEAEYIYFDLNGECEWVNGVMTDYYYELFDSNEYEVVCIENKYGDLPIVIAINEMKETYPNVKVKYYKDNYVLMEK